ncbi:MAG: NAD(P)H-dependent oxidoreductase subunit E [Rhodospirillales bacterium]|nr:MAG: NAD(P)H-dependent oxidoreductase subunit E [Rhodospirillales bacterium]
MDDTRRTVRRYGHPGAGRRQALPHPKGRQPQPEAVDEIDRALADHQRDRDQLIELLHVLQDAYGCLHAGHLVALAKSMDLAMSEVFEVATFYAHFDVVDDGEPVPSPITVRVCESLSCALAGSEDLIAALTAGPDPEFRVVRAPCMGRCDEAPAVAVGQHHLTPASANAVRQAVADGCTTPILPDHTGLDAYMASGGYQLLQACTGGRRTVDDIIAVLEKSGLRGLGGAGFPAGRKWQFVRAEAGPRFMAVNADEGEPGTFKDHFYLARNPHRFLEGMLIAAWAVDAADIYVYLRDEYPDIRMVLQQEIAAAESAGLCAGRRIHLRRGAGAYICGEESAMLESIEGKRGLPRHKPPFPSQVGLFGRPTLIHNVETLYWVREIVDRGADWFTSHGRNGRHGLRSFSVSGRVREPGVKLAPAGITIRELIDEYCGGMEAGHALGAYLPGGASGGILPARLDDVPLDFDTLQEHGCFIGSAAVIVLSDKDNVIDAARNLMRFFEDESCGQCTPCRVGTEKAVRLMSADSWDTALLEDLAQTMMDASICGLGQAAPNPLLCVLRYFADELPRQS